MQLTAGLLIFAASCTAFGQSFEVASIKPAAPPTDGRLMVRMGGDAGRVSYVNVSLTNIIMNAFKVKEHQISGPNWLNTERFDVSAKLPAGAARDQVPAMLQNLLTERFKLTLHREPKVLPAYALVLAKTGLKLQPAEVVENAAPGQPGGPGMKMMMGPRGRHLAGRITLQQLADSLSNWLDRPVVNMTDTKGVYDVDLEWSGDEGPRSILGMRGPGGGPEGGPRPEIHDESADAPSIFTALQEKLGLKLDSTKAPVDILIIDHVEKVPTEN